MRSGALGIFLLAVGFVGLAGCGVRPVTSEGWRVESLEGSPTAIWTGGEAVVVALWNGTSSPSDDEKFAGVATLWRVDGQPVRAFADQPWTAPITAIAGAGLADLYVMVDLWGFLHHFDGTLWEWVPQIRTVTSDTSWPVWHTLATSGSMLVVAGSLLERYQRSLATWRGKVDPLKVLPSLAVPSPAKPLTYWPTWDDTLAWLEALNPVADLVTNAAGDAYLLTREPAAPTPSLLVAPAGAKALEEVHDAPEIGHALATCPGIDLALLAASRVYVRNAGTWTTFAELAVPAGWRTSHLLCRRALLFYVTMDAPDGSASRLYRVDERGATLVLDHDCRLGRFVATDSGYLFGYDACSKLLSSLGPEPGQDAR